MATAPSYKAVLRLYDSSTEDVRFYFNQLPLLLKGRFPLEVCLAYMFLRLEKGQNMALYCGAVKLHRSNADVTWRAISAQHLKREGFLSLFEAVFGTSIPDEVIALIKTAERVRDKVVHGKPVTDREMREAIADVIAYAKALNAEVRGRAGFEPFGKLQGFKGAAKSLNAGTSRLVLKGLGFPLA